MAFTGALEPYDIPLSDTHDSDQKVSGSVSESEEGLLSESMDKTEQTEELIYRETVSGEV